MAPLPFDVGDIGNKITSVGNTAVKGATDVASTVTNGATDIVSTATDKVQSAAATASGGVQGLINQGQDALGVLKFLKQIQGYIDQITEYWNKFKHLIIFAFILIVTIYVLSILYCDPEKGDPKEAGWHGLSRCCLKVVPKSIKHDMEKQHGNPEEGWFDPTYIARACGRHELPAKPEEKIKWHWWGHKDGWMHHFAVSLMECMGKTKKEIEDMDALRLAKEWEKNARNREYWSRLLDEANSKKEGAEKETKELMKRVGDTWGKKHLMDFEKPQRDRLVRRAQKLKDSVVTQGQHFATKLHGQGKKGHRTKRKEEPKEDQWHHSDSPTDVEDDNGKHQRV
ncbi:uncharacterized protein L203_100924 [Cryptococcus depauperatus CBS 7841]|uniref:Uncharacterized protein n=1 Tax=Cryptococcus depauperatus CBS 7841 TaxID=1295531 RepID=A0AAJ8JP06_9TREE